MDAARRHNAHRRWLWQGAALLVALAAVCPFVSVARAQQGGSQAGVTGIQFRKEGERLNLRFALTRPTQYEVVANLPARVLVVKFHNARPAFPNDQRQFLYNDPYVVGILFEQVTEADVWAKVRLRTPALSYRVESAAPGEEMVLGLAPSAVPTATELSDLRLGRQNGASRLVLDLTDVPSFAERTEGNSYVVRLRGVVPRLAQAQGIEDERIALQGVEQEGADTLVRLRMKQPGLRVNVFSLPAPPRIVFDFRPGAPAVAAAPAGAGAEPAAAPRRPLRAPRAESLEELLDNEQSPLVRSNYVLAEREFRAGNYATAAGLFRRVFDAAPQRLLGIRALFRAADAEYEAHVNAKAENFHDVIVTYQSAIRAAETAGYESDLIPRAFYQIGRSYQRMGFHFESNVNYQILQDRFPDNFPYTPDSYYYEGLNYLDERDYAKSAESFQQFFRSDGEPVLRAAAHYRLGDAYFNLKRFVDARTEFEQGRELEPGYAQQDPLLLFHMGETYYETADFAEARAIYRTLVERYPDRSYTKLVALRLGDFLRDEGKEADALELYRKVIERAPPELRLRGMMRIAGIYIERPQGTDYTQGLKLYDEVIAQGERGSVAVQEAMLRKALGLMLHGRHQESIDQFETLAREYPKGPFTRDNLVRANIEENLKSLINRHFADEKYWDIAKLYTRYRQSYFLKFPFPVTLFQVANAYQHLGLYDEAIGLYDAVLQDGAGTAASLVSYEKAAAYLEKDDLGAAETALLRFIHDHKKDEYLTDARMLLGRVYFTGRRYDDALNAYRIIVQDFEQTHDPALNEVVGEVYYRMGEIYKELGQHRNALDSFRAAVANFHYPIQGPDVPEFVRLSHFYTGDMLYELGRDPEALKAYEKAIALYPASERTPWARYQTGLIYRRTGEEQKALETFNELVKQAERQPGELWEPLARENQRDLANKLQYQSYLKQ